MSEHKVAKLVFMISSLRDSGPVNALLEILKIFASRESFNNIEVVTLRPLSENDLSVRFQELDINIHQLSFLLPINKDSQGGACSFGWNTR